MVKVIQSSTERRAIVQGIAKMKKFGKEFFFPSKKGHIMQKKNTLTQKKLVYLAKDTQRKATSEFYVGKRRRFRRYTKQGSKWPVGSSGLITWNVDDWSVKLSNNDVKSNLTKAFRIWAEVSPLVFRWVSPPTVADITIKFVTGKECF